ncbi:MULTISPECIES: UDP-glucose dehydrogenase family protein [Fusobacterium]|uniref:UDP-glucose dehydrogenase family protein n=1 Tax=Fusobacterium TaxID=848 RepID=UPI001F36CC6A|nr:MULTISPECIES: UDP-glucose/GDP-mannose dehydrogenase family protein [Fusobacterium]MCF2613075.1 UDP-glucose/GDP-mannose dehydrogenase family protein [Fusobacterium perfoetens]MDY2981223.1 UDP-glucose/GDP-mannose dehydrogenase family protein [Fusobacterium sp.]
MKISIIGTGYVGLVQGAVMADFGAEVICMDVNKERIKDLNEDKIPIFEPGLKEVILKNKKAKRIEFTTDIKYAVEKSQVIFIAVGTPANEDGSADLEYVLQVAENIGKYINEYKVIVDKSTVPVGTGKQVSEIIEKELEKRGKKIEFDIVSNPEFLREGKALGDCQRPDRVVIGTDSVKAREIMKKVYDVLFINETPFLFTNLETAELIKYASNAFLAVKISFINEIALLAEKVGANTQEIARSMGMDGRISPKFLHCGPGYGGSCFPKDTKAIVSIGKKYGEDMYVIQAAIDANEKQKRKVIEKIEDKMQGVKGKTIGVLGLSFKPDTDDMRDAPSIDIIRGLVKLGAKIHAYCPEGMKEAKWRLEDCEKNIIYCDDEYSMANDVDGIVLMTEWNQFRGMDMKKIKDRMRDNFYFDLRNIHTKDKVVREIFKYYPVGQN